MAIFVYDAWNKIIKEVKVKVYPEEALVSMTTQENGGIVLTIKELRNQSYALEFESEGYFMGSRQF